MSASVGGEPGRRTDAWRSFAWELGDRWADICCAWADRCADPHAAAAALLTAVQLRDTRQTPADAAAEHFMREVDEAAWADGVDARALSAAWYAP